MASKEQLLKQAEEHLGQAALAAAKGNCEVRALGGFLWNGSRSGILVATESGVAFFAPRLGGFDLQSYLYREITHISTGRSMLSGGKVSIDTGGGGMKITGIKDEDIDVLAQTIRQRVVDARR